MRVRCRSVACLASALFVVAALISACGGSDDGGDAGTAEVGSPREFDVMVFNVEYGGGRQTDRVIRRVDADVVGLLESYARLPAIARRTGYPHYNRSLQILSKYPIHEPSGADGLYALIEVEPGYAIPFFNVHLDYVDWGPRALAKGTPVSDVLANEDRVRTAALQRPMERMRSLVEAGYPVFLTGDFNQPSSLDYGEETVGERKGVDEPVPWPVSEELLDSGFRDSYREQHPDPLKEPGLTHERSGERIDYVYAAGPSETLDSELVGEAGGDGVELGFDPWTSDHRAVLSTFEVSPKAMPPMVSVDSRLGAVGDPVAISYNAPGSEQLVVAVIPQGGSTDDPIESLGATEDQGSMNLLTKGMQAGGYEVVLRDGEDEVARVPFWLRDTKADVTFTVDPDTYEEGDPIRVSWEDGPANRWDWIAVFDARRSDPKHDNYLVWDYTGKHASGTVPPEVSGSIELGADSEGRGWPLPPGRYVARYLLADRYESAAEARFRVVPAD